VPRDAPSAVPSSDLQAEEQLGVTTIRFASSRAGIERAGERLAVLLPVIAGTASLGYPLGGLVRRFVWDVPCHPLSLSALRFRDEAVPSRHFTSNSKSRWQVLHEISDFRWT